jgi:hypothetical protein
MEVGWHECRSGQWHTVFLLNDLLDHLLQGPRLAAAVTNAGGLGVLGARTWDKSPEYDTFSYDGYWDNMLRYSRRIFPLNLYCRSQHHNDSS